MIHTITLVAFWCSSILIFYTLIGYSALIRLLSSISGRDHNRAEITPTLSVVIAAHNSQKTIRQKLENTLQSIYPTDKLEIVVASDSSTDDTNAIVRSYADRGVKLSAVAERRGKHYAQLVALGQCSGEIIVFTDSAVQLEPKALSTISSNFADPSVGCVSSEDRLLPQSSSTGEGTYVPAEMLLRRMEARLTSVVGVSGSFFAARREVCDPWHSDESSDFFVPLHCVSKGLRAVVDPASIAFFGTVPSSRSEFDRKVRTIVHGLVVCFHHLYLLDPVRYGFFAVQFLSHKLFRWLLPFALINLFCSSLLLFQDGFFYQTMSAMQVAGYLIAILGLSSERIGQIKIFKLAAFFALSVSATFVAWFSFFTGEKFVTWEPTRR